MPHRIDLNAASADELTHLLGVTPAVAERIIEYRARQGGFSSIDELATVDGVDHAAIDRARASVTVTGDEPLTPG